MPSPDHDKYPFASPSMEYARFKGYNKPNDYEHENDASIHDLLVAFLGAADGIFHELREIRTLLERR